MRPLAASATTTTTSRTTRTMTSLLRKSLLYLSLRVLRSASRNPGSRVTAGFQSLERNHAIPLFVVVRSSTVCFHGRLVKHCLRRLRRPARLALILHVGRIQIAQIQIHGMALILFFPTRLTIMNFFSSFL